jgi:hypothetical protein
VTIAEPHELMPVDPPATLASGSAPSPISSWIASTGHASASAAIWVRAVQVPVYVAADPLADHAGQDFGVPDLEVYPSAVVVVLAGPREVGHQDLAAGRGRSDGSAPGLVLHTAW